MKRSIIVDYRLAFGLLFAIGSCTISIVCFREGTGKTESEQNAAGLAGNTGEVVVLKKPLRVLPPGMTEPMLAELRRRAEARSGPNNLTSYSGAVNGIWMAKYPGVDPRRLDMDNDRDGFSNFEEMLLGTDPFDGKGESEPDRQAKGKPDSIGTGSTFADVQAKLIGDIPRLRAEEAARRQAAYTIAKARQIPIYSETGGPGRLSVLNGFDEDGAPVYQHSFDVASADSVGADELWPTNSVTAVAGWTTGGTGFNLSGGLPTFDPALTPMPTFQRTYPAIGMWEIDTSRIHPSHLQLDGLDALGGPRVEQYDDAPVERAHATAVASVLGGLGTIEGTPASPTPPGTSLDYGNYSRGVAYSAQVHAYDAISFSDELSAEAANDPPLRASNQSFGDKAGWLFDPVAAKWRWYGNGAATEDFKFGAYTSSNFNGTAPRSVDERANSSPFTLLVWAAGNDKNEGPGSLPPAGYLLNDGTTISTAPRDFNDGDAGGYDSLPPQACAKNALVVGAWNDVETSWSAGQIVYDTALGSVPSFTTAGPCDDGRLKPDLVATGARNTTGATLKNPNNWGSILAGTIDESSPGDHLYDLRPQGDGTSYAAPVVTGAVALALQHRHTICPNWEFSFDDPNRVPFPVRSSTVKALFMHTATDVGTAGPDFQTGYGLLNAAGAVSLMSKDCYAAWHFASGFQAPKPYVREIGLKASTSSQFKVQRAAAGVPLKITLVWTDFPGTGQTSVNGVDPVTKRLKHDLDLRVFVPGTTQVQMEAAGANTGSLCHKPWQLNPDLAGKSATNRGAPAVQGDTSTTNDDSTNNVEQIVIPSPVAGDYIVRVTHKGTFDPAVNGIQWFSLVSSGNFEPFLVPFVITGIVQGGTGTFALTFDTVPGGMYNVEGSPNLVTWGPAIGADVTNISARGDTHTVGVSSPAGATQFFWRVRRTY